MMKESSNLKVANALLLILNQNNKRPRVSDELTDAELYEQCLSKRHKMSVKGSPLTPYNRAHQTPLQAARSFLHGIADDISMTFVRGAKLDPSSFTSDKTLFSLHNQDRIQEKKLHDKFAADRAVEEERRLAEEEEERKHRAIQLERERREAEELRLKQEAEEQAARAEEQRLEENKMMAAEEMHVIEAAKYKIAMEERAKRETEEANSTATEVARVANQHTIETVCRMEKKVAEELAAAEARQVAEEARLKREEEERIRRVAEEARLKKEEEERALKAAEAARLKKQEQERKRKIAEEARKKREEEKRIRIAAEKEAKRVRDEEAKRLQEIKKAEAQKREEEAKARQAAESAKKRREQEEARAKKEKEREEKREQKRKVKALAEAQAGSIPRKRGRPSKAAMLAKQAALELAQRQEQETKKQHVCEKVSADTFVTADPAADSIVSSGDHIMFRFAERDCWAVGIVRHACAKSKVKKAKKTVRSKSSDHHWFNVFFAHDKSLLVLNLKPEGKGVEWMFVHDVSPVAWREALKVGDELEMLDCTTKSQWVRGKVTAVAGKMLTLKEVDVPYTSYTTHRLEGCDFAPPLTFIAAEAVEDDHHSLCTKCGIGGDVLLCDAPGCPSVWHQHCVGLAEVPEGDWYCPNHKK